MEQLMEILATINKLSGAGLQFLEQAQAGAGGGAGPEGAPPAPAEAGAPVPPGQ